MVEFFVPGIPVAKGSAKAFYNKKVKRAFVVQDNSERQKPWVSMISTVAQSHAKEITRSAVEVTLRFNMPRPKSHYTPKGTLRGSAPTAHTSKPDLDKLDRAVLDALTSIVWADDSQVCRIDSRKFYSARPGVLVQLQEAE